MKKILAALCALTLTLSLAACGDKDSSSEKKNSKNSSSSSEKKYNENDDDGSEISADDARNSEISEEEEAKAFEKIAGEYYMTGYGTSGNVPEKFEDMYVYQDTVNEEGVTISKDGVLHIEGEDYQLLAQKIEDEKIIFSIKGSGFSLKEYEKSFNGASKNYDGFAVLEYTEQPISSDGEIIDKYVDLSLKYNVKGSRSTFVSIALGTNKPDKNYKDPLTDEQKAEALKAIAGNYTFSYGMTNNSENSIERYKDPSSDEVKKIFEDDPVTITEDGVLHFDGKDYQLEVQEFSKEEDDFGENGVFSVEGCGFSLKEYKHGIGLDVSSKDYAGAALVKYSVSTWTLFDETTETSSITVYVTDNTSESAQVSFEFERED